MQTLGRHKRPLSEINVTPFVDVMLVLLVIFMVTAPLLQQGIDVNLPQAKGKDLPPEERLSVVIRKDGTIFLNDNAISKSDLTAKLRSVSKLNPNVYLKADKDVPYGLVVELMADIKEAGIEKLGMITEPKVSVQ